MSDDEKMRQAIQNIANALHQLGTGDACTSMGALENHSSVMREAMDALGSDISSGLSEVAEAIHHLASAISEVK